MQAYSNTSCESDPHSLPDLEIFYVRAREFYQAHENTWMDKAINNAAPNGHKDWDKAAHELEGFYWWSCFPGCLPTGDPAGPFKTESEALEDAREGIE